MRRRDEDPTPTTEGTGRRAVLRAGAWSLPAIAVVAAAPAHAASVGGTTPSGVFTFDRSAAKLTATITLPTSLAPGASLKISDDEDWTNFRGSSRTPTGWGVTQSSWQGVTYVSSTPASGTLVFQVNADFVDNTSRIYASLFTASGAPVLTLAPPTEVI